MKAKPAPEKPKGKSTLKGPESKRGVSVPIRQRLQSALSAARQQFRALRAWLSFRPVQQTSAVFGLQDLEFSLILILFLFQVVLLLMGAQQSFWWAALCWTAMLSFGVRIVWKWEGTRKFANSHKVLTSLLLVGGTLYFIREPMMRTWYLTVRPSFVLLIPAEELVNCERRAFVVKHIGKRVLSNVEIVLWENGANSGEVAKYPELAPGAPDPQAPKYIWWSPSHPWYEEYTINTTSGDMKISQHLVVRSTKGQLQIASEVSINGKTQFSCRDPLLPASYTLAADAQTSCASEMDLSVDTKKAMGLESSNYQMANGNYAVTKLRTLSAPAGTEGQSENRHIWEYQKTWMIADLSKYAGAKILVLASDTGGDTWKFAENLHDVFHLAKWNVEGPKKLPVTYDGLLDIQVSRDDAINLRPEVQAVINALERAGIKHQSHPFRDADVRNDMIVLWVGSRSPDAVNPNDCASVPFKAEKVTQKPCMMVAQTTKVCPFPPP